MTKTQTIIVEMTLGEAVTLWGHLDALAGTAELRWVRDRLAQRFAEAVDTNIESAHAASVGFESSRRRKAAR